MDNVLKSHSSITKENQILKQRITLLEKQLKAESIEGNDLEQHGRLDQVEINGIPMTDNESCKEITVKIANLCKDFNFRYRCCSSSPWRRHHSEIQVKKCKR